MMKSISAVIITKNEEKNIERCIRSIENVVDEIVIIDSFSTDKTRDIATSFSKVVFVPHEWEGYSRSKNFGHQVAKHPWILSIDADEELSSELQSSILRAKATDDDVNYKFARLTNYCGSWIRHCNWYPDSKIRFFRKDIARWVGESVHETLEFSVNQRTTTLKGDCFHYTISAMEDHFEKTNKYSSLWAKEAYAKGKRKGYFALTVKPVITFFQVYLVKQGFRDGFHGFVISMMAAYSKFQRIAKLINLHKTGSL
jgi:glycosyltransferase involved in cell wall biosynthesis